MSSTAPKPYNVREVPDRGVPGVSRFQLATTPTGVSSSPAHTALVCWSSILADAQQTAQRLQPEVKEVKLSRVVIDGGEYRLIDRGTVRKPVELKVTGSGKFAALGEDQAGSLIDRVILGERISGGIRPEVLWEAAVEWASAMRLDGEAVRRLSNIVGCFLCLQAGLNVSPLELP